ncbi:uncharacterized protein LDX57_000215 [Aspergillus melleus]|uniref:uncharacterized protein n=1 Tax=Aspergillus melleus TaxID=138277 RepID=UPI001E8D650A|nr:uncharacterized protein LDX57_000215 [Aspergillus melleus]KAH8422460.1 hypothetical protein LDX57_000215 [Aspergillus melleus]
MASFLRLPSRLHTPISSLPLRRNAIGSLSQRTYVHDTSQKFSQANEHDPQEDCDRENTPNHPIPSNKAHPTLRDGRQSNLADMEGKRHEDLPEDVRKHNEEMEHRYDRAYNHIADEGKVEKAFEQK